MITYYNMFIQGVSQFWPFDTKEAILTLTSEYVKTVEYNQVTNSINQNVFVVIMDPNSFIEIIRNKGLSFGNLM